MKKQDWILKSTINRKTGIRSIIIEGDAGINHIAEILEKINPDWLLEKSLRIELRNIDVFDLSTVQLLISMERDLSEREMDFKITAELPAKDIILITNCGLGVFINHWTKHIN